jgi:VanZ family protein
MFLRYNLYTIIWALVIFCLILLPGQQMPKLSSSFISIDKLAHAFVFMVLVFLMIVGFRKQYRFPAFRTKATTYALLISGAYALILEFMQFFSSARTVDIQDALANLTGCLLGYLIFWLVYKL